jgi:hypothetical protein
MGEGAQPRPVIRVLGAGIFWPIFVLWAIGVIEIDND